MEIGLWVQIPPASFFKLQIKCSKYPDQIYNQISLLIVMKSCLTLCIASLVIMTKDQPYIISLSLLFSALINCLTCYNQQKIHFQHILQDIFFTSSIYSFKIRPKFLYLYQIDEISTYALTYPILMTKQLLSVVILLLLLAAAQSRSDYKVTNSVKNTTTVVLTLDYTGKDEYYIKPTSPIIKRLTFTYHTLAFSDFTFKITDANNKRFEVPQVYIFPIDPLANFSFPMAAAAVSFEYTESPFDFRIVRKQNGAVIFSTYAQNIIFSDHYLEIGTEVDSEYIYGIGERFLESFRKKDGKWTVFNRDRGQCIDRGEGLQTYGYYPFYLLKEKGQLFHINYLRSSNAMDVIKSTAADRHFITYKVIGGILDFRFFLGEQSPETTVEKLNFYSGRAEVPPFWSFGFHQCRWGYKNVSVLENVLAQYEKNGIPLDTIWNDIDYMIDYEDFTIDESRFPLDRMKAITNKYKYIPIIDAGIKNSGPAYEEGLKRGVYVMDASGKKPYVGKVWPGATTFVDFFHPNATQYWMDMLNNLYNKVQFSGVWLDMNELANFCDGACEQSTDAPVFDYSRDLPYQPGSDQIESHTISLNSTHYGNISEANVHAFSAFLETYATNLFLKSKNLKPFIITRSSTLGSSKYGFHWTGDNYASWEYLRGSIADNFNNQMFGFQMVGPDICGFGGNTNEELCARWYQIGSLYTFARSHNDLQSIDQEPFALGDTVLKSAVKNLKLRYSLLKYFYYLFVTKKGLGSIWRPLFFEYPADGNTYLDDVVDTQFLIGPNFLAAPIVEQGQTSRKVYLPAGNWYYFHTGIKYASGTHLIENVSLTDAVPLFLKEGVVMYKQDTTNVVNTKQLTNHFDLLAGVKLDTRRSNSTHKVYEATGSMLSIKDYNNDAIVDECSRQGCDYVIAFVVSISSTARTLEIDIGYVGAPKLNEQVIIDTIHLTFDNEVVVFEPTTTFEITGPKRVILPIPASKGGNLLTE